MAGMLNYPLVEGKMNKNVARSYKKYRGQRR